MKVPTSRVANQDACPAIWPERGPKLWPVTELLSSRSNKKQLEWNHQDEKSTESTVGWQNRGILRYIHIGTISRHWNDGTQEKSIRENRFFDKTTTPGASPPKFARLWTSGFGKIYGVWGGGGWRLITSIFHKKKANMDVSKKKGWAPQIIYFNRIFPL